MSCGQPKASGARRHWPGVQWPWGQVSKRGRGPAWSLGNRGWIKPGELPPPLVLAPHQWLTLSPEPPLPGAWRPRTTGIGGTLRAPVRNGAGEEPAPPPLHAPGAPARHGDHLLSLTSFFFTEEPPARELPRAGPAHS